MRSLTHDESDATTECEPTGFRTTGLPDYDQWHDEHNQRDAEYFADMARAEDAMLGVVIVLFPESGDAA